MIREQFLAALLFVGVQSYAQLNKGKIMMNGNASFYRYQSDRANNDYSNSNLQTTGSLYYSGNANLNIGYFITNRFAIGIKGGSSMSSQKDKAQFLNGDYSIQKNTGNNLYSGLFARYNYLIGESKFGLFFQLDNNFIWSSNKSKYQFTSSSNSENVSTSLYKGLGYSAVLTPGVLYFINNKLSLEAVFGNLSYHISSTKDKILEKSNSNYSGFGFSFPTLNLGLTVYLGKGKSQTSEVNGDTKVTE